MVGAIFDAITFRQRVVDGQAQVGDRFTAVGSVTERWRVDLVVPRGDALLVVQVDLASRSRLVFHLRSEILGRFGACPQKGEKFEWRHGVGGRSVVAASRVLDVCDGPEVLIAPEGGVIKGFTFDWRDAHGPTNYWRRLSGTIRTPPGPSDRATFEEYLCYGAAAWKLQTRSPAAIQQRWSEIEVDVYRRMYGRNLPVTGKKDTKKRATRSLDAPGAGAAAGPTSDPVVRWIQGIDETRRLRVIQGVRDECDAKGAAFLAALNYLARKLAGERTSRTEVAAEFGVTVETLRHAERWVGKRLDRARRDET